MKNYQSQNSDKMEYSVRSEINGARPAPSTKNNSGLFSKLLLAQCKLSVILIGLLLASFQLFGQVPATPASNIKVITVPGQVTRLRFDWGGGAGANRIVVIGTANGVYTPPNGVASPAADPDFGIGSDLDPGAGNVRCVYNGSASTVTDIQGLSANTPYYVQVFEYNGSAGTTTYNFTTNASNPISFQHVRATGANTFNVPTNVNSVSVQAWGGGGGGGGAKGDGSTERRGGGGGGGAYTAVNNVAVTAGGTVTATIGIGGPRGDGSSETNGQNGDTTTFASGVPVVANGGALGITGIDATPFLGAGGLGATGTFNGGNGQAGAVPANNGRGGGGAGTTAGGANGSAGGAGGANGGGSGGAASTSNTNGNNGQFPSGGGSGAWENNNNRDGGVGAQGVMIVTWSIPVPVISLVAGTPPNGNPVFQVVFSKPINTGTFIGADVTLSGTALPLSSVIAEIAPNNGTTFTITVSGMTVTGTVIANMAAGVVADPSGNTNPASNTGTTFNYTHDITGPTVTISVSGPNPTNVPPVFQVLFNEPITISSFVSGDVVLTGSAGATTPTIAEIAPNDGTTFTVTATGMVGIGDVIANIAALMVTDRAATPNANPAAANLNTTIVFDNQPPTAPGTPTAAAGPDINAAEELAGVVIVVPLGTSGAVSGDKVELMLAGVPFAPVIEVTLNGTDITNTFASITIPTTRLGADGSKSIRGRVKDIAGNVGPNSATALVLNLDTGIPTAPGTPTAAAGPDINAAEELAGVVIVVPLGTSGAVSGDIVELMLAGAPFAPAIEVTLNGTDITNTFASITIPTTRLGVDGAKSIRGRVKDIAGNVGPNSATPLALNLDTQAPLATLAPTAVAGPTIDGAEYTAGFVVNVAGLVAAGAVAGDVLELRLNAASFPVVLSFTLTGVEIGAGFVDLTVVCPQMGADGAGKLITARITDIAGNVGASSPSLSLTVATTPTVAATAMTFASVTTTSAQVNFVNGDGGFRILVARQGAAVSFVPTNNTAYPANNDFNAAIDLGSGNKAVAVASGATITNLPSGDVVHFAVFEYNNCNPRQNYFGTALVGSQAIASANTSTLTTGGGPLTISSIIDTQAEAVAAPAHFSFVVDDDGATDAADAAPTRVTSMIIRRDLVNDQTLSWLNVIQGVVLSDGTTSINSVSNPANFTIAADAITITGITSALATDLGFVADNGTKTFQIKIWYKTNISALDVDDKRLVFTASSTDFTVAGTNSSGFDAAPSTSVTSGLGNGLTAVVATEMRFTTIPVGGTAGTGFPLAVASTDENGNVDLIETRVVTITVPTFPATGQISFTNATPNAAAQNLVAGRRSWTNVKVTAGGNYTMRVAATPPTLTQFTSGIIAFGAPSNASTIAENFPGFVYPTSIDYKLFQYATPFTLAAPPPAGALKVAEFIIQDGGVTLLDADQIGTTLTGLTLGFTNPGNIRYVGIFDGTNIVATLPGAASVAFSGMSLLADDQENIPPGTGQKIFGVYVSFNTNVTDNVHFDMQITNVATGSGGSTFPFINGGTGAGGAQSSLAAGDNRVVVTATELRFIPHTPTTNATNVLIGNAMSPALPVEATDNLGSRDLDVAGALGMTSNGVLSSVPSATLVAGAGTYSAITHSNTAAARTLTTTNGLGLSQATSTTFNITASANSDIVFNGGANQSNIAYDVYQENTNLTIFNSLAVAQFDIRDGGGIADADNASTILTALTLSIVNPGYIRRAALYDGLTELAETTPAGANLVFTGFSATAADGIIPKTLTLRVSFTTAVVDNQQFSFTVTSASTQAFVSSTFAAGNAGGAVTSTAGDVSRIEVTATQLTFTTNFSSPLLPLKNMSLQPPVPIVTAVDALGTRDRDYGSNLTISCALTVTPSITLFVDTAVPNGGLYTFPGTFQYVQTGNGTITLSAPGLTGVVSNPVTVQAATATTITVGAPAVATISSLVNTIPGAVAGFNFNIQDDAAGPGPSDDGLPTLISQIVIRQNGANNTIIDWTQALAGAILTDGVNSQPASFISSNSITFGGISSAAGQLGHIADNATKNYTLRVYLRAALLGALPSTIDGLQFEFQVSESDIILQTNSTGIIALQNATSGNRDVVTVVADRLRFLPPPLPATASLDTDYPGISIEASDLNNNRDLGFTGAGATVREVSNTTSASMLNQPIVGTTQFALGVLNFNANFRYTSGTSGDNVTLTIKAGPTATTTCGAAGIICVTPVSSPVSPTITLLSSFESSLMRDPTFPHMVTLPYVNHQEATDILDPQASSLEIARMLLVDGSRVNFPYGPFFITTGTETDGVLNNDLDGADTRLTSVTIRITNPSNLRRLALFTTGGVQIGAEINVAIIGGINSTTPFFDFVFSGAPLVVAPDGQLVPISVRASFRDTSPEITDREPLDVSVVASTLGSGSNYFVGGGYIAGVPGGYQSPAGFNQVNVLATKLDFTTFPAAYEGVNETVTAGIVQARDQFSILDTDFNQPASVSGASASVSGNPFNFINGVLNMAGLITYSTPGLGTLTVTSSGLSSNTNQPGATPPNVAIPCTRVDVIHVTTQRNDGGPGGVTPQVTVNLLAGSSNQVIFGFRFIAPYTVTGPNIPRVTRFTITFNQSANGIFTNMRVFESTSGSYFGAVQVPGGNVTFPTAQSVQVDLSGSPKDLTALPNLSYFLVVDVDPNVSGATSPIKPSVIDGGKLSIATTNNILIENNRGSQLSNTDGPIYTFAGVAPPTLASSYPAVGQSNIDINQPTIELSFSVPVFTLDQKISLYNRATGLFIADLAAANGFPPNFVTGFGAARPIIFNIPGGTLAYDTEYYITIAPGNLNTNTGIVDASRNLFPGISYSETLFFKTASLVPPKMLGLFTVPPASGDAIVSDITNGGATLNATFDTKGTAYFMVCSTNGGAPPTNAQISGALYVANTVVARGSFPINATHSITQFGTITPSSGSFSAGTHYVWVYAESYRERKIGAAITSNAIPTASPYGTGAEAYAQIGGPVIGPTATFLAPGVVPTPVVTTNNANISLCSNSFQILNTPIIIYEGTGIGQTFHMPTPPQVINLVLPTGFQFDVSTDVITGLPNYGKVTLEGLDFGGFPAQIVYASNSILRIRFYNSGNASVDKIIISNLRVKSNGSATGDIFRLGGQAILAMNDGAILASLSAQDAAVIKFDNSYSTALIPSQTHASGFSETAIPDNAVPALVALAPYIPDDFDFGPTTFSGQGVDINTLNVNGVTKDLPFNITVTHADQNGCVSQNPVQFIVYDNKRAVNITRAGYTGVPATIPTNLDQGPYCATNANFAINLQNPAPAGPGIVRDVTYDNLNAYYMQTLTAKIPFAAVPPIIYGPDWDAIITSSLVVPFGPPTPISGRNYQDYKFDDKVIVNAHATNPLIPYVYNNFIKTTAALNLNYPSGITYYEGGSLGFVELTGQFRNISNPVISINRRQIVQFFVPGVAAIEFTTPRSALITNDPQNAPSAAPNFNNPGTFIFCRDGGPIGVTGWPNADPARGIIGTFAVYNAAVGGSSIAGLTDNSNGTATINPLNLAIQNGGNNIRVEYTYRDASGICQTTAAQVIRISQNPVALFTQISQPSPFVDATNPTAYCEGKPIAFDGTGSSVGGGATIATYTWNFADATNSISSNPNAPSGIPGGPAAPGFPAAGTNDRPVHYFLTFGTYNPTLVITSNFNCASPPATAPVKVGGVPVTKMTYDGIHLGPTAADEFHFRSNNSTITPNDFFKSILWNYGDASTFLRTYAAGTTSTDPNTIETKNYTTTGPKVYNMTITTEIGCINSLSLANSTAGILAADNTIMRTLIVVPRVVVTPASAYLETFEPPIAPTQIWQEWYAGMFSPTPVAPATTPLRSVDPTWRRGVPSKFTPTVNGVNIWTTDLSGTYIPGERSAVYSPSFDLSALTRPMISLDTYTQMENADGVVLQYSIDNKNIADPTKAWIALGTTTDGEFWYTDKGIAAKPGDQLGNDFGWSQATAAQATWLSSRHALVENPPAAPTIITNSKIVFRVALGSVATAISAQGFGFDNIRIGERTRTILLEHFSNTSNTTVSPTTPTGTDESYENAFIATFNSSTVGLEVVKLNYHVNFPGTDPFNLLNPADVSSRALFYNIVKTPAARLDGYAPAPYTPYSDWGSNTFNTRTLRLAESGIVIRPVTGPAMPKGPITSGGKISFYVDLTPVVNLDSATILNLGVVEQLVPIASLANPSAVKTGETSFEYVMRKLLPTASGTRTSKHPNAVQTGPNKGTLLAPVFPAGPITYTFGPFEWTPGPTKFHSPNTGDLGVIAFLQRESGDKAVFQAEIALNLDDPAGTGVITGLEQIAAEQILVYPNPANKEMTVRLPGKLAQEAAIQLVDQTGRVTLRSSIPEGATSRTFNVSDLSTGVYILQIDMGQGVLSRKKVMIMHQE